MECIRYINWNDTPYYSLQIDLRNIDESVFKKWMLWEYGLYKNTPTLTISPSYVVNGDRLFIENYIFIENLIEDGLIHYKPISILGKEIEKLMKYWEQQDLYKDFLMIRDNLDKLIRDADIKDIVE